MGATYAYAYSQSVSYVDIADFIRVMTEEKKTYFCGENSHLAVRKPPPLPQWANFRGQVEIILDWFHLHLHVVFLWPIYLLFILELFFVNRRKNGIMFEPFDGF